MTVVDTHDASQARERSAAVLRALKSYRGVTDSEIAVGIGASRAKVQTYTSGISQLTIGLMYDFARYLDVDPSVFLMEADEALKWTIDNRPNADFDRESRALRNRCSAMADGAMLGDLLIPA